MSHSVNDMYIKSFNGAVRYLKILVYICRWSRKHAWGCIEKETRDLCHKVASMSAQCKCLHSNRDCCHTHWHLSHSYDPRTLQSRYERTAYWCCVSFALLNL